MSPLEFPDYARMGSHLNLQKKVEKKALENKVPFHMKFDSLKQLSTSKPVTRGQCDDKILIFLPHQHLKLRII